MRAVRSRATSRRPSHARESGRAIGTASGAVTVRHSRQTPDTAAGKRAELLILLASPGQSVAIPTFVFNGLAGALWQQHSTLPTPAPALQRRGLGNRPLQMVLTKAGTSSAELGRPGRANSSTSGCPYRQRSRLT